MEEINIKKHPPWYARGTPVTNNRDGPAMALSDTPLIVIRRKSSASGAEEDRRQKTEVGIPKHREETRRWLTLLTTRFSTKNNVFSHWYAQMDG